MEAFRQKLGLLGEHQDDEMLIKALLWVITADQLVYLQGSVSVLEESGFS